MVSYLAIAEAGGGGAAALARALVEVQMAADGVGPVDVMELPPDAPVPLSTRRGLSCARVHCVWLFVLPPSLLPISMPSPPGGLANSLCWAGGIARASW